MAFSVERVPDEPIIIMTILRRYDFEKDAPEAHTEVDRLLEEIEGRAYLITDYSQIDLTFSQLVVALGRATRGETGSASDPRIRQNIFVGEGEMVDLAAESLLQTQYGKLPVVVFPSLEKALTYVRALTRPLDDERAAPSETKQMTQRPE